MSLFDHPRYKENPIYIFFEQYVLDTVCLLSETKVESLRSMDLQSIFNTHANDWRNVLEETLHLSPTIELAIWDLWAINRQKLLEEGTEFHPYDFAQGFVDNYMAEDSRVDKWTPESLASARKRLATLPADMLKARRKVLDAMKVVPVGKLAKETGLTVAEIRMILGEE